MFEVITSEELNHRIDFALLCNERHVRIAVEVGTDQGWFAKKFMERFNGELLLCVDSYKPYEYLEDRQIDMMQAVLALQPWHGRVRFLQMDSTKAAAVMPTWYKDKIDFIYIDGDHSYKGVCKDLKTWWPLLSHHGILAGHDYDETHPGVMRAVKHFAKKKGLTVRVIRGDSPESWYVYKTEPTHLKCNFFKGGSEPNGRYNVTE